MEHLIKAITENHAFLYRIIKMRVGNDEDTKDILQDTLKDALESYDANRHKKRILPWLITIAKNNTYTFLKRRKITENIDNYSDTIPAPIDSTCLEIFLLSIIKSGFDVPNDLLRYLFISIFSGVPLSEVSQKTNIPYTKLRYWKDKLLKELRRRIDEENFF